MNIQQKLNSIKANRIQLKLLLNSNYGLNGSNNYLSLYHKIELLKLEEKNLKKILERINKINKIKNKIICY